MPVEPIKGGTRWELPRLGASGPDPEYADRLAAFGRFVGDWEIVDCRYRQPSGEWSHLRGELHWRWILRGKAVQDVWTLLEPATGALAYEGTTVRFYDRRTDRWSSTWISSTSRRVRSFIGHVEPHRIVLDEKVSPGAPAERWVFADITTDSFRWYAEVDHHDGEGWIRTEEMEIERRPPPPEPPAA